MDYTEQCKATQEFLSVYKELSEDVIFNAYPLLLMPPLEYSGVLQPKRQLVPLILIEAAGLNVNTYLELYSKCIFWTIWTEKFNHGDAVVMGDKAFRKYFGPIPRMTWKPFVILEVQD